MNCHLTSLAIFTMFVRGFVGGSEFDEEFEMAKVKVCGVSEG